MITDEELRAILERNPQLSLEDQRPSTGPSPQAQQHGRQSQSIGASGEEITEYLLRQYDIQMLEQITTPFAIIGTRPGGWIRMARKKKVSGDWRGVMGDGSGRRVLAEVKATGKRNGRIAWSRLKDHQVHALDKNNRMGAVSLLVVVFGGDGYVLRWPVDGFLPGTSLDRDTAVGLVWDGVE